MQAVGFIVFGNWVDSSPLKKELTLAVEFTTGLLCIFTGILLKFGDPDEHFLA